MAVARKCDRCGAFYDEPKMSEVCGIWWMCGSATVGSPRDLCPKCTDELSDWMEGGKLNAQHGEDRSGLEEVGSGEAEETVCEAGDSEGGEAEPADLPDVPEEKPEKFSRSVEDQVRMRLSGMRTKDVAAVCHVTPATVSANVSNFKKKHPERYAELVAEYEKPAVEVTEGNQ